MTRPVVSFVRLHWTILALVLSLVAVGLFIKSDANEIQKDQFEIDINATCGTEWAKSGYYIGFHGGTDPACSNGLTDDWATQATVPNGFPGNGIDDGAADCQTSPAVSPMPAFLLCNGDRAAGTPGLTEDCYDSEILANPLIVGKPVLICDGNSGGDTLETELDIVSSFSGCSDQKTNDSRWCVKRTGELNNPAKSDETHGYTIINRPGGPNCLADNFIVGGYERLGNEGTVFAGFVFAQKPPAVDPALDSMGVPTGDSILNFTPTATTGRTAGDILVLLNQEGQNVTMFISTAPDG